MAQKETNTLSASTVQTVTLTGGATRAVEIVHHGNVTNPIFVRTDGVNPAIDGDDCDVVLAGERVQFGAGLRGSNPEIRLISVGLATYTVSRML
jgi:hypothetical protein